MYRFTPYNTANVPWIRKHQEKYQLETRQIPTTLTMKIAQRKQKNLRPETKLMMKVLIVKVVKRKQRNLQLKTTMIAKYKQRRL